MNVMADARFPAVRGLIFDLDGTLIDSKLDLIHSVNAMLRKMKRPQLAEETISGYIGHGAPQLVARALGGTATDEDLKSALQFFLGYYEEHKMDNTCAYPGVAETLAQLNHLPMAVLTNKPAEALLVGDSEVDVQTARNAGMRAAAVNYGFGVHDRAAYPADIYLDRFADLSGVVTNHTAA